VSPCSLASLRQVTLTEQEAEGFLRSMTAPTREQRQRLASLFGSPAAVAVAETLMTADEPDGVVWASLLVYSTSGPDVAPLAELVDDRRAPVRVTAAGALLARGDRRGFPPLVDEIEAGIADEAAAWQAASWHLARWTARGDLGPPLDADVEQRRTAASAWAAWYAENEDRLQFSDGRWRVS
jgi:hypothetical protein